MTFVQKQPTLHTTHSKEMVENLLKCRCLVSRTDILFFTHMLYRFRVALYKRKCPDDTLYWLIDKSGRISDLSPLHVLQTVCSYKPQMSYYLRLFLPCSWQSKSARLDVGLTAIRHDQTRSQHLQEGHVLCMQQAHCWPSLHSTGTHLAS